ncbi:MAG: hypothetical protein ACTSPB_00090 [Candidatus Thorarchaeota archaeon]
MLKDTKKAIMLNMLAQRCGYFKCGDVNNGYGCTHPDQEETQEFEGVEHGCCFSWSCPIAVSLNPCEEPLDREYFEEDEQENWVEGDDDMDWMLVHGLTKRELMKSQEEKSDE